MNDLMPEYAFVPGGPFQHPNVGRGRETIPSPIEGGNWRASPSYLHGFELFNAGYYWEAHEVWESLWHVHGRLGSIADLLKGLIKLAAAGVKVRQGQPHGIVSHATRAGACFASASRYAGRNLLGLDLEELQGHSRSVAENPPSSPADITVRVARVFEFTLLPESIVAPEETMSLETSGHGRQSSPPGGGGDDGHDGE